MVTKKNNNTYRRRRESLYNGRIKINQKYRPLDLSVDFSFIKDYIRDIDPSPEERERFNKIMKKYPTLKNVDIRQLKMRDMLNIMENKDKNKSNKILNKAQIRECKILIKKNITKKHRKLSYGKIQRRRLTKSQENNNKKRIKKCKKILKDL